jgi:hypothetical protein
MLSMIKYKITNIGTKNVKKNISSHLTIQARAAYKNPATNISYLGPFKSERKESGHGEGDR